MKKVTKLIAPPFVIIAFCLLTFGGCKKKSNDDNKPRSSLFTKKGVSVFNRRL